MHNLKDDMQFITENRKKSRLTEKLNESFTSLNDSNILNGSILSNLSTNTIKKKYNLKESMDNKNLTKFQDFLSQYNENKNLLLLVDSKNAIWEIIKRPDLSPSNIANGDNIVSIISKLKDAYNVEEKLLNIEIKDNYDNRSVSELDISKVTDLNISHLLRETNIVNTENA
jgi:cytoplasmic iron level regulating protein YaaA (DUF328/UPF0246 family)